MMQVKFQRNKAAFFGAVSACVTNFNNQFMVSFVSTHFTTASSGIVEVNFRYM